MLKKGRCNLHPDQVKMYKEPDEYNKITNKERARLSFESGKKVRSSLERMAETLAFPRAFHDEAGHSLRSAGFKDIFSHQENPGYSPDADSVYDVLMKNTSRVFDAYSSYLRMIREAPQLSYEGGSINNVLVSLEKEQSDCWNEIQGLVNLNISFIRKRLKSFSNSGNYDPDLEAEGIRGLIEGSLRFDPSKGYAFLTYARHWVDYYMREHSNGWRSIMLHPAIRQRHNKILTFLWNTYSKRGEFPDVKELSECLDLSSSQVSDSFDYLDMRFVSMDSPCSCHDDRTLSEILPSDDSDEEEKMASVFDLERISDMFSLGFAGLLTEKEMAILRMRFSDEEHTLKEIGKIYDVSRERIRQIQNAAIDKLRDALESRNIGLF